jgi:beta-lactamase superfamily II metal-dependent hydrolase
MKLWTKLPEMKRTQKKMKYFTNLVLVVGILFSKCVLGADEARMRVSFFDVGQGHCTVVSIPGHCPLLVDAGSLGLRGDNDNERGKFKKKRIGEITKAIADSLLPQDNPELKVIVSHGDEDHCNWVQDITKGRYAGKFLRLQFLLGGDKGDYSKKLKGFTNYAEKFRANTGGRLYVCDYAERESFIPFENEYIKVLSAIREPEDEDKNTKSIVLRIVYGFHMVILTGDATGETTQDIIKDPALLPLLKASILQAAHHGADSEGSNNQKWLSAVEPQFFVMSAGERSDYLHPRAAVIESALCTPRLRDTGTYHLLQYYDDGKSAKPNLQGQVMAFASRKGGYKLGMTTHGLYNTTHLGNIHFSWTQAQQDIENPNIEAKPTLGEAIFHGLSNFSFTDIEILNLSKLQIQHKYFSFLPNFLKRQESLRSLRLALAPEEEAKDQEEMNADEETKIGNGLEQVIKDNQDLIQLDLSAGKCTEKIKQQVLAAWNNRGLILPAVVQQK